jgi:hypothetical protein
MNCSRSASDFNWLIFPKNPAFPAPLRPNIKFATSPAELRRIQRNRGDVEIGERIKFARLRDAVAIGVDPDLQLRENRVVDVDHAVVIGVILREIGEAGLGEGSEQFRRVVDRSIAVLVKNEKAFIASGQAARALGEKVIVQIEMHARLIERSGDKPSARQIEHEGVSAGEPE